MNLRSLRRMPRNVPARKRQASAEKTRRPFPRLTHPAFSPRRPTPPATIEWIRPVGGKDRQECLYHSTEPPPVSRNPRPSPPLGR